jgi:hypothetical protein
MSRQKICVGFAALIAAALLVFPGKLIACMPSGSQINGLWPSPILFCGTDELPGGG